jgi:hypothetical protein
MSSRNVRSKPEFTPQGRAKIVAAIKRFVSGSGARAKILCHTKVAARMTAKLAHEQGISAIIRRSSKSEFTERTRWTVHLYRGAARKKAAANGGAKAHRRIRYCKIGNCARRPILGGAKGLATHMAKHHPGHRKAT